MVALILLRGHLPTWLHHVMNQLWRVVEAYGPRLARWNWWVILFVVYLVGCLAVFKYWRRITRRFLTLLVVALLGVIVFAPPMQWIRMLLTPDETSTLKNYIDTGRDLLIGVVMAGFVGAILARALENKSEVKPTVPIASLTDFLVLITEEDDLLRLDQSRFLESGFGGLSPGKRRRT
jgi:hypothetical protein